MYGGSKTKKASLLSCIKDVIMQGEFKRYIPTIKSKNGKTQTINMQLETLKKMEASDMYLKIKEYNVSSGMHKHVVDFIPNMEEVLLKMIQNKDITEARREEKKAVSDIPLVKKGRGKKKIKEEAYSNTEKEEVFNVVPPSYMGFGFMDLYVKQNISSYKLLNSQTAQQTIWKVDDAYKSFFEKITKGLDGDHSPPNYIRTNKYNLICQNNSFAVMNDKVRMSVSKEMKKTLTKQSDDEKKGYLYFPLPNQWASSKTICEIEIVPSNHVDSNSFKLILKYKINIPRLAEIKYDNLNKASIDLGVSNVATVFSPCLNTPIIFSGKGIVALNKKYNALIDTLKSDIKRKWDKHTCRQIQELFVNRSNHINNAFHNISNSIIQCCKINNIHELIIGYNTNWKSGINIGKNNNRQFYAIPYRKFLHMLFYKGEQNGIKVVENEEAYTSKCDALGLEDVKRHDEYMGKRKKRGLFQSSKGVFVNADVNGAINIMRKYCLKVSNSLNEMLEEFIKTVPLRRVCNPITVFRKLNLASMTIVQMAKKGLMTAPSCS